MNWWQPVVPHLWARWRRRLGGGRNKVEVNVALLVNLLGQFPSMPFVCLFLFFLQHLLFLGVVRSICHGRGN